jgi:hypothetical protein
VLLDLLRELVLLDLLRELVLLDPFLDLPWEDLCIRSLNFDFFPIFFLLFFPGWLLPSEDSDSRSFKASLPDSANRS